MNSGKIFSHRDKELHDHLISTTAIADVIAKGCGVELSEKDRLAILLHDIAKAHPRFQKRLLQNKGRFGHAEPSSALVFGLTRDIICAEAIRRHHSRLQNIDEVKKFWGNEWDYKTEKAGGLNSVIAGLQWWQGAEEIAEKCRLEVSSWLDLLPDQDEWEDILFDLDDYGCDQNEGVVNDWLRLRMLYSILVAADRYEAAVSKKTINYSPLISNPAKIDDYLSGTEPSDISAWRNEIRLEVVQNAERFIQKPGVFTLTLPTGAGKTLIGMEIAMQVARRFQYSTLIYVLPFVSLVEQNADVAAKLFDVVQEDHYLSYPESDSEEATPEERFVAFFRYWQEPVIVTTLAKLWNVLYSPRANDTMSFHRLSNSVVILDEPQVVRTSCWEGFGKTLQLLVDKLRTTFILMTATQPEIARGTELAPESVKFPLVRHELHWISGQGKRMSIAEAADFLVRHGVLEKSSLLVLNTRESALRMYGEMKKRGAAPLFLSGWVTPNDRRRILLELKKLERARKPRILVATQVIEAGVDLSFELVFRDLGPLDSIVQVAGRCNRHCQPITGQVYIGELVDERGRTFASMVYDRVLLNQTRLVLREDFNESQCSDIIAEYYENLKGAIDSSELWPCITAAKWGEFIDIFEEDRHNEATLIVDYCDELAHELKRLYVARSNSDDVMKWLEDKKRVYRKVSQYSVSVPITRLEEWNLLEGGMIFDDEEKDFEEIHPGLWIVRREGIGRIYRPDIGFIPVGMAEWAEERYN